MSLGIQHKRHSHPTPAPSASNTSASSSNTSALHPTGAPRRVTTHLRADALASAAFVLLLLLFRGAHGGVSSQARG